MQENKTNISVVESKQSYITSPIGTYNLTNFWSQITEKKRENAKLTLKNPAEMEFLESIGAWQCLNSGDLRPPADGITTETSLITPEICILFSAKKRLNEWRPTNSPWREIDTGLRVFFEFFLFFLSFE